MEQVTLYEVGTVLQFPRYGGSTRTVTVRVLAGRQYVSESSAGTEYFTFEGVRVRPNGTNVSFGNAHLYTVRSENITVKGAAQ